jgi:signal transduction histidine kinase
LDQPLNTIWLADESGDILRPVAATDEARSLFDELPTYTGDESLSWHAFETGEVSVYDDLRNTPERYNTETPIKSEIVLPLGEYGVMNFGATEPRAFNEFDVSLARLLGNIVESALIRANREENLQSQRKQLERQNERLEEFTSVVSHDLRNPLQVADGRLELVRDECESDHIDDVAQALDRMDALIEDMLTLAREGNQVDETELIGLANVVKSSWQTANTEQAVLEIETSQSVEADRTRLQQLFENLYRNAVEHGGDDVTVSVGAMDDGFYVADTGPGIPEDDREDVFEAGYSTNEDGTGFGLRIVEQIASAHGWEITVTESEAGGARFEVTGVEFADR